MEGFLNIIFSAQMDMEHGLGKLIGTWRHFSFLPVTYPDNLSGVLIQE